MISWILIPYFESPISNVNVHEEIAMSQRHVNIYDNMAMNQIYVNIYDNMAMVRRYVIVFLNNVINNKKNQRLWKERT